MFTPPKKRIGAQPGNRNALKHGFYSRKLPPRDLTGLDSSSLTGLVEEIALIRVFTRRLVETLDPSAGVTDLTDILRALCLASSTITRIIKAQSFLSSDPADFYRDVEVAISKVRDDLGL